MLMNYVIEALEGLVSDCIYQRSNTIHCRIGEKVVMIDAAEYANPPVLNGLYATGTGHLWNDNPNKYFKATNVIFYDKQGGLKLFELSSRDSFGTDFAPPDNTNAETEYNPCQPLTSSLTAFLADRGAVKMRNPTLLIRSFRRLV